MFLLLVFASIMVSRYCSIQPLMAKVAQVQRVLGNNLFNEQHLAVAPEEVAAGVIRRGPAAPKQAR